ncbi:MAG: AMP-binding protein, partial [bacterium]|nr:AMP-binding protein [bacterium]
VGVRGEICVAGIGVGRGYWKDEEKTAKAFVPNPLLREIGDEDYAGMYKTGDIGYYREDGNIECLGRLDHQVKIRGNRIELGEIENQILTHTAIKEVVVLVREDGNKTLCAYIVVEKEVEIPQLRGHLNERVPDYMIPAHFVQLKTFPLTPNGKIDRKALPEPDLEALSTEKYTAPRSETEEKMVQIWKDILKVERIGIDDNFFEMGGDSIKAIQLASKMQIHGVKVEIGDLFLNPTIRQVVKLAAEKDTQHTAHQGTVEGEVPFTPIQEDFFRTVNVEPHHYNQAVLLKTGKNQGFEEQAVRAVFEKITQHHDALRMVYPLKNGKRIQVNRGINDKNDTNDINDTWELREYDFHRLEEPGELIQLKIKELHIEVPLNILKIN